MEQLGSVAMAVKASRDAQRQTTLVQELRQLNRQLVGHFRLPLNPAIRVKGIDIEVGGEGEVGGRGGGKRV